jgi:hypothetical protein
LGPQLFEALNHEAEVLEQKTSLAASQELRSSGLRQSVSAKKSMKNAILSLNTIHQTLIEMQKSDADMLKIAFKEVKHFSPFFLLDSRRLFDQPPVISRRSMSG